MLVDVITSYNIAIEFNISSITLSYFTKMIKSDKVSNFILLRNGVFDVIRQRVLLPGWHQVRNRSLPAQLEAAEGILSQGHPYNKFSGVAKNTEGLLDERTGLY